MQMNKGFHGTGPDAGVFVAAEDSLPFALERCGLTITNTDAQELEAFLDMFEEWFYSSWVKEETEE